MNNQKKSTTRFLTVSLLLVAISCVCIFSFLAFFMNRKSADTISSVGTIYMTGMGEKVSQHFETTIDLRLIQVESLVDTISSGSPGLRSNLVYNAQARGFEGLSFYSDDGTFDTLYGDTITLADSESFLKSLRVGAKKVAVGVDPEGEKFVLLGVPAQYPM